MIAVGLSLCVAVSLCVPGQAFAVTAHDGDAVAAAQGSKEYRDPLEVDFSNWPKLEYGYTAEDAAPIDVVFTNTTKHPIDVYKIKGESEDGAVKYQVNKEGEFQIAPGQSVSAVTVTFEQGLDIGEYYSSLSVDYSAYDGGDHTDHTVKFTPILDVDRASRTVTVEVVSVGVTEVELTAKVSAGADDGTLRYVAVKAGEELTSDVESQLSPVIEDLDPDTEYDVYARITMGTRYDGATSDSVRVRTLPDPNPDPEPDPEPDPSPDPAPDPDPDPAPDPDPDPDPKPDPDPDTDKEQGLNPGDDSTQNSERPVNTSTDSKREQQGEAELPATDDPAALSAAAMAALGGGALFAGRIRRKR